jgi:hypothetical protein
VFGGGMLAGIVLAAGAPVLLAVTLGNVLYRLRRQR